jgi:hypothetical protein
MVYLVHRNQTELLDIDKEYFLGCVSISGEMRENKDIPNESGGSQ